ncbi:MAG: prolyl oligopeptidase family serine peptidase [Gemmatimonadota bacterium]
MISGIRNDPGPGSRAIRVPTRIPVFFLLSLVFAYPTPGRAQEGAGPHSTRPLQVEDLFRIKGVGSPVVSPDGEWVAYTVSTPATPDKKGSTRIWMVGSSGAGPPIPMTAEGYSASNPEWSPDGQYLSFMASRGDSAETQVWILDRRLGEGQQLTDEKWGINGYEWSPDATRILLTIRDPDPVDTLPEHKKPEKTPPWEIDRLQFKRDRVGYLTGDRHTHLYVFDVATRKTTRITSGDYDAGSPAWSPDGTKVAFVANRTENPDANANTDIWVVDADNTDQGATLVQVTTNPGADGQPAWSPDGEWIAHVTSREPEIIWYDVNELAVARADGSGELRVLTEGLDRNVTGPRYARDGRSIFVRLEDSAENHLARVDVRSGQLRRPVSGKLSVGGFDLGPRDEVFVGVSRTDLPGEIFALSGGELEQLTMVNEDFLEEIRLGRVFDATFPSADGTEIEGLFYLPPGYTEGLKYPTLLRIHGGPVSQYSHSFNFEAHLFAANGYVVVTTNPRGSSGYGQDFSHAIWADWGNKDYQDVMAGVDYALREGWSDADRLGVGGWSYGGILTDHVITKTDRFKAAITGASEVLYVTNYGHDHYQLQWEKELGLPWENREAWERISPFNQVEQITTPTLIMGGEKDWNVPINNGEQLYQALRRMGKTTQLVVYPGQSHGLSVPEYQADRYQRYLDWYDKYVKQLDEPVAQEGR